MIGEIGTTGNAILGNRIGLAATSGAPLGNTFAGVSIITSASGNVVGGTVAGAGNVIANNGDQGVWIQAGSGNSVARNRVFDNGDLGIDLGTSGVTANDLNDADLGANNLLNFPLLIGATLTTGGLRIAGSMNTVQNMTIRIEFFASPTADTSGNGEGRKYLGFVAVTMGPNNTVSFSKTLAAHGVLSGQFITATATDELGNTSEFSVALTVT